jgi:hypothetical protein
MASGGNEPPLLMCPHCGFTAVREAALLTHQFRSRECRLRAVHNTRGSHVPNHANEGNGPFEPAQQDAPSPDDNSPTHNSMSQDDGEDHSGGSYSPIPSDEDGDNMDVDEEEPDANDNVWAGMEEHERMDWMLVTALSTAGLGGEALTNEGKKIILDLLRDPSFDFNQTTVRTATDVQNFFKRVQVASDKGWLERMLITLQPYDPKEWGRKVRFYRGDALAAAIDMVKSKEASSGLIWEWEGEEGTIVGPLSGAKARRLKDQVKAEFGPDVIIVPLTWYSDKTHLDVKGRHKCHPGFLKLAGWKDKMFFDKRGARVVALLPILPDVPFNKRPTAALTVFTNKTQWKNYCKMRRFDIHQQCIDAVLSTLRDASHRFVPSCCT